MAGVPSVSFSCTCGKVHGQISPASAKTGAHLSCFCPDCRAAERYLGQPDRASGGIEMFQTNPDTIHIEAGKEQLAILRLSPKGPLRWYATCCKSPLFNTLAKPGLPFVTAMVARIDDPAALGPITAQSFVPQPSGPPKHKNGRRMVWGIFTRMIAARLSGRWKQTPFFDLASGEPIAPVHVIDKEERKALYG